MFTSRTFAQRYLFYVYNDTSSRNCNSIINVNREKCQIIKSQCWRFQARHKLWNSKRREIPKSDDRRFKTVTKPAFWVQFAVKKNRVDHKNLLHLKYTTSQKWWGFFSVLIKISFHKLLFPVPILNWYAARLNSVHIMTEVMIWNRKTLKNMEVNLQGSQ